MTSKTGGIRRERSPFEWSLLIGSLVATVAIVVGLAVAGLSQPDGPADLRVRVDPRASTASGGRAYEVSITNHGGESAANVAIDVTAGEVTREVTVGLVADGDTTTATVVFPPGVTERPRAEVVGFEVP